MTPQLILTVAIAAMNNSVPPDLLLAICFQESSLRPHAVNPNDGGSSSIGVCQVKLTTAKLVAPRAHPSSLFKPAVNADVAAKLLRRNLRRYRGDEVCAADAHNKGTAFMCERGVRPEHSDYTRRVWKHRKERPWTAQIQKH